MNNCPNCGAPIVAPVCDYCGTRHYYGPEDVEVTSKIVNAVESGLMTPNEARGLLGLKTKMLAEKEEIKILYMEAIKAMRRYNE